MSTLVDYIKWRGDLYISMDGFNDFDNLVFSAISYVMLDGIFCNSEVKELTIKEAADLYFKLDVAQVRNNTLLNDAPVIFKLAADSRRFSNVIIKNYVNRIDVDRILQFSAMEFILPDGSCYVAFRGTDDTIVGWKEDFMMAVSRIEAEKEAVAYLNLFERDQDRPLRIGGHSKGGHLAVYAAAMCIDDIQDRIIKIYSNDGPGFSDKTVLNSRMKAIEDRVLRILPEESIVGMLMEHVGKKIIVKSTAKGALQHNLMTWSLDGMKFDRARSISKEARAVDKSMREWLSDFSQEDREKFVDDLFSVLEAPGVMTLTELMDGGVNTISIMTKHLNNLSPLTRDRVGKIIKLLFKESITR